MSLYNFIRSFLVLLITTVFFAGLLGVAPTFAEGGGANESGDDLRSSFGPRKTVKTRPRSKARRKAKTPKKARGTSRAVRDRRQFREVAASGTPPVGETRFLKDQVIVRFRLSASQAAMNRLVSRLNIQRIDGQTFLLAGITVQRYQIVSNASVRNTIAALEADPTVVYAQPNYLYELQQTKGASKTPQYALERLSIVSAHKQARGLNVRIAVIDTAIDTSHPELASAAIETYDVTGQPSENKDSHGTSIAGILASRNTLSGIAPDAKLIGIRAFSTDKSGKTYSSSWIIAKALELARKKKARVLNLSFAGPSDPLVKKSLRGSQKRGMIAIAAAGNAGPGAKPLYPAGYKTVLAVTATDSSNSVYRQANRGTYIAISAPGVDILTLGRGEAYNFKSGTSLASAHISGLVALLLSANSKLSPGRLTTLIAESSSDLGDPGRDDVFGSGIPDAAVALKKLGNK